MEARHRPKQEATYQKQLELHRVPPSAKRSRGWSRPKQPERVDQTIVVRLIRKLYYDKRYHLQAVIDKFAPQYGAEFVEDVIFYRIFRSID